MHANEGFVPFRGYRTWYRVVGDEQSEGKLPVVILHGGPGATHDYLEPLEALAQIGGRRVVFYDQLGCGKSDLPDDESLWVVETFVESVLTPAPRSSSKRAASRWPKKHASPSG